MIAAGRLYDQIGKTAVVLRQEKGCKFEAYSLFLFVLQTAIECTSGSWDEK